jgi:hypothetical protein
MSSIEPTFRRTSKFKIWILLFSNTSMHPWQSTRRHTPGATTSLVIMWNIPTYLRIFSPNLSRTNPNRISVYCFLMYWTTLSAFQTTYNWITDEWLKDSKRSWSRVGNIPVGICGWRKRWETSVGVFGVFVEIRIGHLKNINLERHSHAILLDNNQLQYEIGSTISRNIYFLLGNCYFFHFLNTEFPRATKCSDIFTAC